MSQQLTITVGPELFQFESRELWKYKAAGQFRKLMEAGFSQGLTISIDAKGRICGSGPLLIHDDPAYPIRVYAIDPEATV